MERDGSRTVFPVLLPAIQIQVAKTWQGTSVTTGERCDPVASPDGQGDCYMQTPQSEGKISKHRFVQENRAENEYDRVEQSECG